MPQLFSVTLRELDQDGKRTGREINSVLSRDELMEEKVMDAVTGSMLDAVNAPGVPHGKMILFGKEGGYLAGCPDAAVMTVEPVIQGHDFGTTPTTITINEVGDKV